MATDALDTGALGPISNYKDYYKKIDWAARDVDSSLILEQFEVKEEGGRRPQDL
jgi:hypothetical protein